MRGGREDRELLPTWALAVTLAVAVVAGGAAIAASAADGGDETELRIDTGTPQGPAAATTTTGGAPVTVTPAAAVAAPEGQSDAAAIGASAPATTVAATAPPPQEPPVPATTEPVDWAAAGACLWGNPAHSQSGYGVMEWRTAGGSGDPAAQPGEWAMRAEALEAAWPGRLASFGCL